MQQGAALEGSRESRETALAGLGHVATVSFLASRASPTAGFWIALAGGVALARAGAVRGARWGYGVSLGAMLETVAIMGPARFGVPLTQALTAPLLGVLNTRGTSTLRQVLACAGIRIVQNAVFVAFFIFVLAGGLDAYAASYDAVIRRIPFLPEGTEGALVLTGVGLIGWAAFASSVQVLFYQRGLRSNEWREPAGATEQPDQDASPRDRRRFDPRAVSVAAVIAFVLLLSSTEWAVLAAVSAWLVLAWLTSRPERGVAAAGVVIAAMLALGVLSFTLIGGIAVQDALRRAARAGLLVLVATWLRAAAGSEGIREVSQRTLGRLRWVPSVPEAIVVLDRLGAGRQLGTAARAIRDRLRSVPKQPQPILDAVLAWVVTESARFRPPPPEAPQALTVRAVDLALVALALAPVAALIT